MRCTRPRTVGFLADGKTISWSKKTFSKEYATFELPCGKCLECRLEYARTWAIRCVHEAKMHDESIFVTLTYAELDSPKLNYSHFQKFMKRLRRSLPKVPDEFDPETGEVLSWKDQQVGVFVTGEYGDETKRPHWHAILFGYRPKDEKYFRSTNRGDRVFVSDSLSKIWAQGHVEYGSVTFESAGYCARYAAKKLAHGKDADHDYHPISRKSSKHAIGKKWLEKYFLTDCFNQGYLLLPDGAQCGIPRYYEKWFKENHPDAYRAYISGKKSEKTELAQARADQEKKEFQERVAARAAVDWRRTYPRTGNQIREQITKQKFEQLQNYLKLK